FLQAAVEAPVVAGRLQEELKMFGRRRAIVARYFKQASILSVVEVLSAVEVEDRGDDVSQLRLLEFRVDEQRQGLLGGSLGMRKIAGSVVQVGETGLQMQGHRVVDFGADAVLGEPLFQSVAALYPHHVLIENMPPALDGRRRAQFLTQPGV